MEHQHGTADFVGVVQNGHVDKGQGRGHIPAVVGVEGPLGVPPLGLVVVVVVLEEEGGVLGQRVHHTPGPGVGAGLVVLGALGVEGLFHLVPGVGAVGGIKVALGVDPAHVIHGGGDRGFDAGVHGGGVEGHAAKAADTQNADLLPVHKVPGGQKVHGGGEVLGVDVGGGHVAHRPAALSDKGGVKGQSGKATAGQLFGVQPGALLFYRSEGAGHRHSGQLTRCILGQVQVSCQLNAVAVVELHLLPAHGVPEGEGISVVLGFHGVFPPYTFLPIW